MVRKLVVKGLLGVGKGVQCICIMVYGLVVGGGGLRRRAQHLVNKKGPSLAQGACRDAIDK